MTIMESKRSRPITFVCSAISGSNELISKIVIAKSVDEASKLFFEQHKVQPKEVLGPFYRVKTQILENTRVLKFADNRPRKAIYNDWVVNAFVLSEPSDHAYLIFLKRTDDKKIPFPKGTITAPIQDLRFI